jgi:hypothetical protein
MAFHLHLSPAELLAMPISELNWLFSAVAELSEKQEKELRSGRK